MQPQQQQQQQQQQQHNNKIVMSVSTLIGDGAVCLSLKYFNLIKWGSKLSLIGLILFKLLCVIESDREKLGAQI